MRQMSCTMLVWMAALCGAATGAWAQPGAPLSAAPPQEGDYTIRNFTFSDGQTLPEIRLHYTTLGAPQRDGSGQVTNAVVILHGTNRAGRVFLVPSFAGELFRAGQPLDTSTYYVILPDQLGAGMGKSSKPSDGLRAKFPRYDYSDMLRATQTLLTDGLKVNHLRLVIGTSMGCMEGFMWAESRPDDADALVLLSCLPVEIGGRNRMVRKIMIDDVRLDPGWNNGNYDRQPYGLRAALGHLLVVGSAPVMWQRDYPTAALADRFVDQYIEENLKTTDANDFIYQYDASRHYNPERDLGRIRARLVLINAPEDFWNPEDLGIAEQAMKQVKNGTFVLLPMSAKSRGHYTFFEASLWKSYLSDVLEATKR